MLSNLNRSEFIEARKNAIAKDFSNLNDMQLKGVLSTEGPLLLLAGAGSGKTTVLISRIANLLRFGKGSDCDEVPENVTDDDVEFLKKYAADPDSCDRERMVSLCAVEPVEPWRVIAITFTNKAATELKTRLENMLGAAANDIWAKTFHSACVRILRRDIDRLGYDKSFTIYDTGDAQSLVKRVTKDLDIDDKAFPYRTVMNYISRAKDEQKFAEAFCAEADKSGDVRKRIIGRIYAEYERRMRSANALDFDDIILLTVKLLEEYEDVRSYYQRLFRYILIDEYQDTNELQYKLAKLLAGERENICVVGDDDQSIYKFRGATIENILGFEKCFTGCRVIKLEQNYRSTGHILAAANDVIANNKGRKGKKLWTEQNDGEMPELNVSADERDEAMFVASKIVSDVAAGGKWSDHAVLYRMNAQSNNFEYAFKRSGIPYRVFGGTKFFDRLEIKDMLAYLCVVNSPSDDMRLLRIINTPARGIGATTIDQIRQLASELNVSMYDIILNCRNYRELERSCGRLCQFSDMVTDLREKAAELSLDEFYDYLIERTGYVKALEEKNTDENASRIENIGELKNNIVNYLHENENGGLSGFLDEIALYTDLDDMEESDDCTVMMTIHSAKGLEFPTVFIVGAEEGIFPSMRVIGEIDEMEEERRLCYVAMTRARKKLYITCAKQRMMFGKTQTGQVSRFVDEISSEHIVKPTIERYEPTSSYSRYGQYSQQTSAYRSTYKPADKKPLTRPIPISKPAPKAALPDIKKGDRVVHKAFGDGFVTNVTPAGGDALIEIAFDSVGTKRLMLKTAMSFMKILK